jgi:hypothetical protein
MYNWREEAQTHNITTTENKEQKPFPHWYAQFAGERGTE